MTDDIDNDATTLHESGGVVQPTDAQIALQQIADWRLPPVQIDGVATSYESAYGSNGARDYMREIARRALPQAPLQAEPVPVVASEPVACEHGCTTNCLARTHGAGSECPMLPLRPPFATPQAEPAVAEQAPNNGRADGKHWLDGFAGAEVAAPAATFGIIDPDYARIFTKARILAWSYGYACVAHGSFTRDLDLLLVPWTEQATPESAVRIIRMLVDSCDLRMDDKPADKPNGRRAYSLHLKGFGEPRWVDLSVVAALASRPAAEEQAQDSEDWVNKLPYGEGMTAMKTAIRAALASQSTPPPESAAPQGMASDAVARAIDAFADRERGRPQAFMAAKLVEEMRAILAANPTAQPDGGSKA